MNKYVINPDCDLEIITRLPEMDLIVMRAVNKSFYNLIHMYLTNKFKKIIRSYIVYKYGTNLHQAIDKFRDAYMRNEYHLASKWVPVHPVTLINKLRKLVNCSILDYSSATVIIGYYNSLYIADEVYIYLYLLGKYAMIKSNCSILDTQIYDIHVELTYDMFI